MPEPPDRPPSGRRRPKHLMLLLKIAVSALLVAYIVWQLRARRQFEEIGTTLGGAQPAWLVLGFALQIAGTFIAAWRWRMMLRLERLEMPFRAIVNSYFVSNFFINFLPGQAGGDVVRAYDSSRHTGETTRAITVVVLTRVAGLVALVVIGLAAMGLMWREVLTALPQPEQRPLYLVLGALALGLVALAALTSSAVARLVLRVFGRGPLKRVLAKVLDAVAAYRRHPRGALAVIGISLLLQTVVVLYYYVCTLALGTPVAWQRVAMAVPVVLVLMMAVPSVNSLGVRTWGFQAFLFTGLDTAARLPASASLEIVDLVLRLALGLIGGVLFILRRRQTAPEGSPS
jgi:uncharacterized protein (TIRG00374 family)